jgi:hypothetical protein
LIPSSQIKVLPEVEDDPAAVDFFNLCHAALSSIKDIVACYFLGLDGLMAFHPPKIS